VSFSINFVSNQINHLQEISPSLAFSCLHPRNRAYSVHIESETTGDEMTYLLTSSCRASSVSFASVSEAEAFLASRKLSEETVCLCDKAGNVIFTRTYN
jgi:hypothetical protein